jgi:hypothetical protein
MVQTAESQISIGPVLCERIEASLSSAMTNA